MPGNYSRLLDPTIAPKNYGECSACGEMLHEDSDQHVCEDCHEPFCAAHVVERDTPTGTEDVCEACAAKAVREVRYAQAA